MIHSHFAIDWFNIGEGLDCVIFKNIKQEIMIDCNSNKL